MEYTINNLAKIAKISTRTLRYYDQIGLLKPARINSSNYRIYGQIEVDKLQQILFYRELGFELDSIKKIINAPNFKKEKALYEHLVTLQKKRMQINLLIKNLTKTIDSDKNLISMTDKEKFEGFKQKMIDTNEQKYGEEIRKKYDDSVVDATNSKIIEMTPEKYKEVEVLNKELNETLKAAVKTANPAGELAQKVCELHKKWICSYWADGMYSKSAHKALAQSYVDDTRFTAYYDKIAPGSAKFLRDAVNIYCAE